MLIAESLVLQLRDTHAEPQFRRGADVFGAVERSLAPGSATISDYSSKPITKPTYPGLITCDLDHHARSAWSLAAGRHEGMAVGTR